MRYRLRTLLVVLAFLPPAIGLIVWPEIEARYRAWLAQKQRDAIDGNVGGLNTIFAPMGPAFIEVTSDEQKRLQDEIEAKRSARQRDDWLKPLYVPPDPNAI